MEYEREQRIELFRQKIKEMSNEELIALSMLMRRGTLDLAEEMKVLQEHIFARKTRQMKNDRNNRA